VIADSNIADVGNLIGASGNSLPFLSGQAYWGIYGGEGGSRPAGQTYDFTLDWSFNCTSGNFNSPCCPPDPQLESEMALVIGRLNEIWALVSAGQGHGAYVDTVVHPNLSGEGTIGIEPSSRAIRVEILSDLTNWPHHPQIPNYYYSLGFITPVAVGTPVRGQRLIYNHQTFTWPSYTDQIAYTLGPGLTINLIELE
jgi:hypothetical protein